ncbi:MAG: hypothetical protein H0V00_06895 [Chloroflexia bacterium]|nr:hypothetical protein [Chloroflexia bacterium]
MGDVGRQPADRPATSSRLGTNRPTDQAAIAPLTDLIANLSRENQELAAAAALWQERARFLGEQLRALEAGPVDVAGDQGTQELPQERNAGTESAGWQEVTPDGLLDRIRRLLGR